MIIEHFLLLHVYITSFYLLFLHFNFQLFDFISEVLGKFLDLTLHVVLESSPLTSVLHRHPFIGLLSDEE